MKKETKRFTFEWFNEWPYLRVGSWREFHFIEWQVETWRYKGVYDIEMNITLLGFGVTLIWHLGKEHLCPYGGPVYPEMNKEDPINSSKKECKAMTTKINKEKPNV